MSASCLILAVLRKTLCLPFRKTLRLSDYAPARCPLAPNQAMQRTAPCSDA
jgi:hypothetical protein